MVYPRKTPQASGDVHMLGSEALLVNGQAFASLNLGTVQVT